MSKPIVRGYEIHEVIGKGAGSKIYRATQVKTGREVAIKHVTESVIRQRLADTGEYKPHRYHGPIDYASYYSQLKLEYDVCQRLARTPVRKYAPEVFKLRPVRKYLALTKGYDLIMEYVPGVTLREERDYSVTKIINFYYQAARLLYALHGIGLLHCDLKPQHLIVTPDDRIKLLDYGQVRKARDDQSRLQGTPDYMAPEQMKGMIVDERTDVYSLGATFYWILTGKSNRPAMSMAGASVGSGSGPGFTVGYNERAKSIREENPSVPEALERLILDSCQPRNIERPGSMREVVERLELLLPN